ncbi:MAG: hypothetical protein N4A76_09225 [Firmicutes bacterium]|jgi:hypothetical protein|nr:hypothetical protein [Bacillota bacterium]
MSTLYNQIPSFIITILLAIITAWITGKITFKSDIKKYLHSKRQEIYISLFELLDQLINDQSLVYNDSFKSSLMKFKPRLKLVASKSVIKHYEILYKLYMSYQSELKKFVDDNSPYNKDYAIIKAPDENGNIIEYDNLTKDDVKQFNYDLEEFKNINIARAQEFIEFINNLANQMRKDIGNKKYKW